MRHVYFKLSWEPYQVNRDEQAEKGEGFPKFDKLKVKIEHNEKMVHMVVIFHRHQLNHI